MSPDEVIGMAIFFGSIISVVFIIMVGSIIKAWIKKDSTKNLSENQEFLDALREFKENMERRMSNLEEIVLDDNTKPVSAKSEKRKLKQNAIQLEMDDELEQDEKTGEATKLKNMLTH